jgi:general stress protein 26
VALALLPIVSASGAAARTQDAERGRVLEAAAEIMASVRYCALVTVDAEGAPQTRAMDPFPPEADLTVWLGTNASTRKVDQIRHDPRVTLFYFDPDGPAYVTLVGEARLVDDPVEKARRFKPEWDAFYDAGPRGGDYVLIRVDPLRVEVVSAPHGIAVDPKGWKPAIVSGLGAGED